VKKVPHRLCTSDRGLCGGFNANLIDAAEPGKEKAARVPSFF
jgi:F0F1-type ATP synthase gamma subunit